VLDWVHQFLAALKVKGRVSRPAHTTIRVWNPTLCGLQTITGKFFGKFMVCFSIAKYNKTRHVFHSVAWFWCQRKCKPLYPRRRAVEKEESASDNSDHGRFFVYLMLNWSWWCKNFAS
jgi:hypothetical protein